MKTFIEVQYKKIINGELSSNIETSSNGTYATEAFYSSTAEANEVITGLGFRNDASDVKSMWIFKGTYRDVLALAPANQFNMSMRPGVIVPIDVGGVLAPIQIESLGLL